MRRVSMQLKYRFEPKVHLTKEQEPKNSPCDNALPLAGSYDGRALRVRSERHEQQVEVR
jgi:hypothetical protein